MSKGADDDRGSRNTSTASWILPFSALTHPPHNTYRGGTESQRKTSHCHDEGGSSSPTGKDIRRHLNKKKTRFVPGKRLVLWTYRQWGKAPFPVFRLHYIYMGSFYSNQGLFSVYLALIGLLWPAFWVLSDQGRQTRVMSCVCPKNKQKKRGRNAIGVVSPPDQYLRSCIRLGCNK